MQRARDVDTSTNPTKVVGLLHLALQHTKTVDPSGGGAYTYTYIYICMTGCVCVFVCYLCL